MPDIEPTKYESGSKNTVAILGLNESLKWLKETNVEEKELTTYLYEQLIKIPKVTVYVPKDVKKCIEIVSANIEWYSAEEVGNILDEKFDIAVRTGYHCSPLIHEFIGEEKNL